MKVEIKANYWDSKLNQNVTTADNIHSLYKKANIELTKERVDELVAAGKAKVTSEPTEVKTTKAADVLEDNEVKIETAKLVNSKTKKSIKKK